MGIGQFRTVSYKVVLQCLQDGRELTISYLTISLSTLMNSLYFVLPFLSLLLSTAHAGYEGQQVLRFANSNKVLQAARELKLDVWGVSGNGIDIRVNSIQRRLLGQRLGPQAQSVKVLVQDLQKLAQAEAEAIRQAPQGVDTSPKFHENYHSFDDIKTWLKAKQQQYPNIITYEELEGETSEHRKIPSVILNGNSGPSKDRTTFWFQAMQHAREWIAGSSALYVIDYLATNYSKDSTVKKLLDNVQFVIVPVCNPDGYDFSFRDSNNRFWRKSRGEVDGVDLNRNWPESWDGEGSSTDPYDETYRGASPGSAPEVQALIKAYKSYTNVVAAQDLHTYSQLILRPYGSTSANAPDENSLKGAGEAVKAAIYKVKKAKFVNEHVIDLYPVNGGSVDWFYGAGTPAGRPRPYSFTFEMTDGSFSLPPSEIVPTGKETVNAILATIQYALKNPLAIKK